MRVKKRLIQHLVMTVALMGAVFLSVYASFVEPIVSSSAAGGSITNLPGGLSGSYDSATWSYSGSTLTGTAKSTKKTQDCKTTYTQTTSTLTLQNISGATKLISFSVTTNGNCANWTIGGKSKPTGEQQFSLENNEQLVLNLTTSAGNDSNSTLTLSNFTVSIPPENLTVTFLVPVNGSYSVNGTSITTKTDMEFGFGETVSLVAVPSSGYSIFDWKINGSYISQSKATLSYTFAGDCTCQPVFCYTGAALFSANSKTFFDLNDANNEANAASNKTILVTKNGVVPAGNYSISSGVTLYVPYDATTTPLTTEPAESSATTNISVYRKLTLNEGVHLSVSGSISLGGSATDVQGYNGEPVGGYGCIVLSSGSDITLNDGSYLYCWGYVFGAGEVIAKDGSTVYECFQTRDWRGGSCVGSMINNTNKLQKVFPISNYYAQNIESKITFEYGSAENLFFCVSVSFFGRQTTTVNFIGKDSGMFQMQDSTTRVVKKYNYDRDGLDVEIYGEASLSALAVSISLNGLTTVNINSADYILPLNSGMKFTIAAGAEVTISQDVAVLPGTILEISSGATVTVESGYSLYLYDKDQWKSEYVYKTVRSVHNVVGGRTKTWIYDDLSDAKIDINGTFKFEGYGYSVVDSNNTNGADVISSSGTGKISFENGHGSAATTYQVEQDNTTPNYKPIPVTPLKLTNDDGFTLTSACPSGSEYFRCSLINRWARDASVSPGWSGNKLYLSRCGIFAKGLHACLDSSGNNFAVRYFGTDGAFASTFTGTLLYSADGSYNQGDIDANENPSDSSLGYRIEKGDNQIYYVVNGVVQMKHGLFKDASGKYYYFDANGHPVVDGTHYVSGSALPSLPEGHYEFTSPGSASGHIKQIDTAHVNDNTPHVIGNYCGYNGVKCPYGLFSENGYYYYARNDGTIAKNCTCYVGKTNNLSYESIAISAGLYYFDANGHMYSSSFVEMVNA